MAEAKKTSKTSTPRVTAAQVNEKVDALASTVEELSDGVGRMVELLSLERAAKAIAESQPQTEAVVPPVEKTPVGQREGDAMIRNLRPQLVRLRIGKPSDPYRIELQARGTNGDTVAVPASLRADMIYKRNIGLAFEEISTEESDALVNRRSTRRRIDPLTESARQATVSRDEDRTVARLESTVAEDRFHQIGPRYIDVPGSNNPSDSRSVASLDRADAEYDPEYRQWLEWLEFKRQQENARQGVEPSDFSHARASGYDPVNAPIKGPLDEHGREAQAMQRYLQNLEKGGKAGPSATGVIPAGELTKPVVVERVKTSVQPAPQTGGKRRIPGV